LRSSFRENSVVSRPRTPSYGDQFAPDCFHHHPVDREELTVGEVVRRGFAGFANAGFRHSQTMIEVRRDPASFFIANGIGDSLWSCGEQFVNMTLM
jgi:hypothetical protein